VTTDSVTGGTRLCGMGSFFLSLWR
jgi:hypothetical protein